MKVFGLKRIALAGTLATLLCFSGSAEAQKVYRVSGLIAEDQFASALEGFKNKMSEIGYREDKNIRYEFHNAKGDIDSLHKLAQKIVREKPDLIVTSSTTATIPVAKLTEGSDLPVVFLSSGNPLKLVRSYGSSGNNLTGIASAILDLTEKRLELFREIAPAVRHVIFVTNPRGVNYEESRLAAREAAKKMGLTLTEIEVPATNAAEVKKQIFLVTRKMGEALLLPPEASLVAATEQFAVQAIKEKIPAIGANVQTVRRGLLAG